MASSDTPKTILLRGRPAAREATGSGALTPGMLVATNSAGAVIPHGVAAGKAEPLFVREEEYVGGSIDTAYASGDRIPYWACVPGDQVYALLETGANVAIGALLESNGAGYLQANTAFAQGATTPFPVTPQGHVVAKALEAVDNSGGGAGPAGSARIKVEIV